MANSPIRRRRARKPILCDCGNLALKKSPDGPVCARCAELERGRYGKGLQEPVYRPYYVEPYRVYAPE